MSHYSDIGNLMYLDLDLIKSEEITNSEYLIKVTAQQLRDGNSRNWIPVIVREVAEDHYQVVGNSFIYEVAKAASMQKIWCIIADDSEETAIITKMLAKEIIPKINLSTASKDDIEAALEYLVNKFSILKGVKISVATNSINKAPRQYWQDFKPIAKLKCGITLGKKIEALKQVFYLTPQSIPDDIKEPQVLNIFNISELKKIAKKRKLTGYSKLTKNKLVNLLSQ